METYEAMRQFADSWGLVAMMAFFLTAVVSTFGRRAGVEARKAAQIPLLDTPARQTPDEDCSATCNGEGQCKRLAGLFEEERIHG